MKSFLTAGLALASCVACAGLVQNFDAATNLPEGFSGEGTIEQKAEGNNMLSVEGQVTCSNGSAAASEWTKTSFLVKAPEDASDVVSAEDLGDCQTAVATGAAATDSTLKVMVYQGGENPAWVEANATVAMGAWFSVGLEFNYAANKVKVMIDNQAAGEYALVSGATATSKISSLVFAGSAKVDEVSIQEAVAKANLPADIKGLKIYAAEQGVTEAEINNTTDKYADMTVAQRLEAGLAPKGTTTFVAESMSTVTEGSAVKTVVSVPCASDNGQVYTVVVTDGEGALVARVPAEAGAISGGVRPLTFDMPATDKKVLKITVQASAPSVG